MGKNWENDIIEKLKEDLINYEIFFNNSSEGFLIHREGEIIIANSAVLNIFGLKPDEVAKFKIFDFVEENSKKIIQDNIKNKYEGAMELNATTKQGKNIVVFVKTKEIIYRNKPARAVFVKDITEERLKLINAQNENEKIAKQRKTLVAIAKISSKVGVFYEETIKDIIELVAITLNTLFGGFFILSDDKKYLNFVGELEYNKYNIKKIDFYKIKNFIDERILIFNNEHDIQNIFPEVDFKNHCVILSPVKYEGDFIGTIIFIRKDKVWLQYEQDFIASVSDMITLTFEKWEKKWIEVELEQNLKQMKKLNRVKNDFISMISHELRTPLTSIIGYISFLLKGIGGKLTNQQREFLLSIDKNSKRLLKIINDLLDISKIEKNTFSVSLSEVDIIEIINNVLFEMSSIFEMKKVKIIKNFIKNKIIIKGDSARLMQMIANIIDNAIKYSLKNVIIQFEINRVKANDIKKINIQELKNDDYCFISIKDNGIGIKKEKLEDIFNIFTQLEEIETRKQGGVGLGLYIAKEIVKQHNGFIWAESEGEGKGTTFNILLPLLNN